MQISKEKELREKWNKIFFGMKDEFNDKVADWWLKELSLALEEKVKEIEKIPRRIVQMGVDKNGKRFEIVENSVRLDDIINLLKQK
jgi:hypothetical protein